MKWLRQSTAVDIPLGPFLDSSDGNTQETGLTLTQPDIRLSKNGAAFAQKSAAQTLSHMEAGYYSCNLSTTDTGTLGRLRVAVHESGALPVWEDFTVIPADVYDVLVAGTTTEPTSVPSETASFFQQMAWLISMLTNEQIADPISVTVRNRANSADIGVAELHWNEDTDTATRGNYE